VSGRAIDSFWKKAGLSLPVALDPEGRAAAAFGLRMLPMTFLSDDRGQIRQAIAGARDWTDESWVRALKASRSSTTPA
jgi:peroxiredoxin